MRISMFEGKKLRVVKATVTMHQELRSQHMIRAEEITQGNCTIQTSVAVRETTERRREPRIAPVIKLGLAIRRHEVNLSGSQVLVGFLSAFSAIGLLLWAFLKLWLSEP